MLLAVVEVKKIFMELQQKITKSENHQNEIELERFKVRNRPNVDSIKESDIKKRNKPNYMLRLL